MTDQSKFQRARNRALTEWEQGRDELCRQILATPADRRWTIDPNVYARLSPGQLRRVLADTTGDATAGSLKGKVVRHSAPSVRSAPRSYREPGVLRRAWRRSPVGARAALLGMAAAIVANVGLHAWRPVATLIKPAATLSPDVNRWPPCPRLDPAADACVYIVQNRLRWSDASQLLALPLDALRASNRHLAPGDPLTRGAALVVWRGQLRLE